jgi:hypothetical protein
MLNTFSVSRSSERKRMKHPTTRAVLLVLAIFAGVLTIGTTQVEAKPISEYPCREWHKSIRKHGLPIRVFAPIMWRESKCEPKAVGWNYKAGKSHKDCKLSHASTYKNCKAVKSYDVGLLQINSSWKTLTAQVCKKKFGKMLVLQNPDCNLKVAAVLYNEGKGLDNWQATSGTNIKKATKETHARTANTKAK